MAPRILVIDTSTQAGSIALCEGEEVLGEFFVNVRRTHSEMLLEALEGLLKLCGQRLEELAALGCVLGPGSFTGVRIGAATVQGLALSTGLPVVTATSLETLAQQVPDASRQRCVMIDARKNEVYCALYPPGSGEAAGEPRVLPPERVLQELDGPCLYIGDGAQRYRTLIVRQKGAAAHFVRGGLNHLRASSASVILQHRLEQGRTAEPHEVLPLYIRPSDAELSLQRKLREASIEG